jgi:uncharacterized phage-associated protein
MTHSTANRVADAIISLSNENSLEITNLKLQKILYYAQAWHLVLRNGPLFGEDIEAWVHGPVVPCVFRRFKNLRWDPIPSPGSSSESKTVSAHLTEVWRVYGKYDATELERRTHSETPWKEARRGLPPDVASHNVISHASMRKFYSSLLNA